MNHSLIPSVLVRVMIAALSGMTLAACGGSTVPPTAPTIVTPAMPMARLTVTTSGGNLTSTPPGIDCRSESPPWTPTGKCAAGFARGVEVTLHFTPTIAAGVVQFSVTEPGQAPGTGRIENGDKCVIKLDGDRAVAANIWPFRRHQGAHPVERQGHDVGE